MFLKEQGYVVKKNVLHQDNQSAMKIILNGKRSSGAKTKHMDNRFFWIKDRLKSEGIEVKYCPTAKMIADFFTKPLQGRLFRKLQDVVMGYKHIDELWEDDDEESTAEERVGKQEENGKKEQKDATIDNPVILNKIADDVTEEKKHVTWAEKIAQLKKIPRRGKGKSLILLKQSKL